jgi:hypothetical protein
MDVTTARTAGAAAAGGGIGVLAALAALHGSGSPALGAVFVAGAVALGGFAFVGHLLLEQPDGEPGGPGPLVAFLLAAALGLMLAAGTHGSHG